MRTEDYIGNAIEEKTMQWLSAVRSRTAARPQLKFNPQRAALLIVDMQRYFAASDGRCRILACDGVVKRVELLLSAWRTGGGTVIFTRHCHSGKHDTGMLGRFFSDFIREDEESSEIIDSLHPLPNESVIKKKTYDAFLNTNLETLLREKKLEQVLITGVLTHMCCETVARSAFCRGFEVYIPADGTASRTEELHLNSLISMGDSVAVITSVEEVLLSWNQAVLPML